MAVWRAVVFLIGPSRRRAFPSRCLGCDLTLSDQVDLFRDRLGRCRLSQWRAFFVFFYSRGAETTNIAFSSLGRTVSAGGDSLIRRECR